MTDPRMTPEMVQDLTHRITDALNDHGFGPHLRRIWLYRDHCLVVDLAVLRIHFGFDLTLLPGDRLAVDLVQRGALQAWFSVTPEGKRKQSLAGDVATDEAIATVMTHIARQIARIRAFRADPGTESSTATDAAPAGPVSPPRRPKVGVLTLPMGRNIGGNLQAFALMQVLRDLDCDPVLINRRYVGQGLGPRLTKQQQEALPPITNQTDIEYECENQAFIETNILPITRSFRSSAQLARHIGDYDLDAVVAGSDQVWRPKYARGLLTDFFHGYLGADEQRIRRVSYAASFGADEWEFSDEQTQRVAELAGRFDAVSVREDSAVDLCRQHLEVKATHVLDPTLLLSPSRYLPLFADRLDRGVRRRITSYVLDPNQEKLALMGAISDRLGMDVISAGAGGKSVEGWLAAFYQADFIFTDSFHGTAFSILFNKPFIAFGNPQRGMARFTSILKMVGLSDRLVTDAVSADVDHLLQPIDWDSVNRSLEIHRTNSTKFLYSSLALPSKRPEKAPLRRITAAEKADENFIEAAREMALFDTEKYSAAYTAGDPRARARARMMFHAHGLEKGLSHTNFRAGFGEKPMRRMAKATKNWLETGGSAADPFFKAAISAAHTYFVRHRELGVDVSHFWEMFSPRVQQLITSADGSYGGALAAKLDREPIVAANNSRSFTDVVYGRRSVREFTSTPIKTEQIKQAVQIASQAPSVCNRQGPRVHYFDDPVQIRKLVDVQGGFAGYPKPPGLLLVTCDLTAFIFPPERNQGFIDGGLFMMALLLGLEQVGLGACSLNAAMDSIRESKIRRNLDIPDSEALISFIAVGNYDPSVLVARSLRYPVEHLLSYHGRQDNTQESATPETSHRLLKVQ